MTATPAWAHVGEHPCITIRCTDCNERYGEDGTLHFATITEAEDALSDGGWEVIDGDALCDGCAMGRVCAELGHKWEHVPLGSHRNVTRELWRCTRCAAVTATDPQAAPAEDVTP